MSQIDLRDYESLHNEAVVYMKVAQDSASRAYQNVVEIINRKLYLSAGFEDWRSYARHFLDECGLNVGVPTIQQKLRTYNRLHLWAGVDPETAVDLPPATANAIESLAAPNKGWAYRKEGEPAELIEWKDKGTRENARRFVGAKPDDDDRVVVRKLTEHLSELAPGDAVRVVEELKSEPGSIIIELGYMNYDHATGRPHQHCQLYRRNCQGENVWQWQGDIWSEPFPPELAEDIANRMRVKLLYS